MSYQERSSWNCISNNLNCRIITSYKDNSVISKYIKAKWLIRQEKYNEAKTILENIKPEFNQISINDTIKQSYIIDLIFLEVKARSYNSEYAHNILNKHLPNPNISKEFKARIFTMFSFLLRESNQFKEAIAYGIYAEKYIQHNNLSKQLLLKATTNNAISYYKEELNYPLLVNIGNKKINSAIKYIDNSNNIENFKTLITYKLINETNDIKANNKLDSIAELFKINKFYYPEVYNFYLINKSLVENNEQIFKTNIASSIQLKNYESLFWNTHYLLEHYLTNTTKKDTVIHYFNNYNSRSKNKLDFLLDQDISKMYFNEYCKSRNSTYLDSTLFYARKSRLASIPLFQTEAGIHFEDFINENHISILNAYHIASSKNHAYNKIAYLQDLISGKSFKINLSENKKPINPNPQKLAKLKSNLEKINKIELTFDNYKKIDDASLETLEKLTNLYFENALIRQEFKYKSEEEKVIDPQAIQSYLTNNKTLVLDFSTSPESYYLSAITGTDIKLKKLDKPLIDSLVAAYQQTITRKAGFETLRKQSSQLYNLLVKPYLSSNINNIIIIPDNNLHNLPFEAIVDDNKVNPQYLVSKYDISYHYNIGDINTTPPKNKPSPKATIISYSDRNTIVNNTSKVSELTFGLKEANNISKLYSNPLLITGKNVTGTNFQNSLFSDVVHLSTHTFSDPSQMYGNYILLRDKSMQPSQFYGFELNKIELPNNHIILSSCNSGTGISHYGAGTFSLSRDFLQAGARSVVKTLWSVNDASTAKFMLDYHKNLMSKNTIQSISSTKRTMLQHPKYNHPYYWAAFVLEGNL